MKKLNKNISKSLATLLTITGAINLADQVTLAKDDVSNTQPKVNVQSEQSNEVSLKLVETEKGVKVITTALEKADNVKVSVMVSGKHYNFLVGNMTKGQVDEREIVFEDEKVKELPNTSVVTKQVSTKGVFKERNVKATVTYDIVVENTGNVENPNMEQPKVEVPNNETQKPVEPSNPNVEVPNQPEVEKPNTEVPNKPEIEVPETPKPELPNKPETEQPKEETPTQPEKPVEPSKPEVPTTPDVEKPTEPIKPEQPNTEVPSKPEVEKPTTPETKPIEKPKDVITSETVYSKEVVPFNTITVNDSNLEKGTVIVEKEGVNGEKLIMTTYKVVNGVRQPNPSVATSITQEPVNKIVRVGTKVLSYREQVTKQENERMTLLEEYAKAYPSMTDEERLDAKTNKDNKYNSIANRYFTETHTFGKQNIGRIEKLYNQIANSFNIQEFNEIITRRANEERAKLRLQPLVFSEELSEFAKTRANEALVNYDHTRPDGRKFSTVFADASPEMAKKYAYSGENLAGKI